MRGRRTVRGAGVEQFLEEILTTVTEVTQGRVHFASLADVCHLKNAECAKHSQKYKGRVVLRETM